MQTLKKNFFFPVCDIDLTRSVGMSGRTKKNGSGNEQGDGSSVGSAPVSA
jgi:hypothetical protein